MTTTDDLANSLEITKTERRENFGGTWVQGTINGQIPIAVERARSRGPQENCREQYEHGNRRGAGSEYHDRRDLKGPRDAKIRFERPRCDCAIYHPAGLTQGRSWYELNSRDLRTSGTS